MIRVQVSGNTNGTDAFLKRMQTDELYSRLAPFGQRGVDALRAATPVESGVTADSWSFEIRQNRSGISIWWLNSHTVDGFPVAIGLQYGHGTGTGGYVQGRDFINPALAAIFDEIADSVWKEVQRS